MKNGNMLTENFITKYVKIIFISSNDCINIFKTLKIKEKILI